MSNIAVSMIVDFKLIYQEKRGHGKKKKERERKKKKRKKEKKEKKKKRKKEKKKKGEKKEVMLLFCYWPDGNATSHLLR